MAHCSFPRLELPRRNCLELPGRRGSRRRWRQPPGPSQLLVALTQLPPGWRSLVKVAEVNERWGRLTITAVRGRGPTTWGPPGKQRVRAFVDKRFQKDTMDKKTQGHGKNIDLGLNLVLARGLPYVWS